MPSAQPISTALLDPDRLLAVRATDVCEGTRSAVLDGIARAATRALAVPTAMVCVLGADREFLPGLAGGDIALERSRSLPLDHSVSRHLLGGAASLAVDDTATHPLTIGTPVVCDLGVRAWLGVPLVDARGQVLGALCAWDRQPRQWSASDTALLRDLSPAAGAELARAAAEDRYQLAIHATAEVFYAIDPTTGDVWREGAMLRLFGREAADFPPSTEGWLAQVHPVDRDRVCASWETTIGSSATSWECEYHLVHADGHVLDILDRAAILRDEAGRPVRIAGAMVDVTAERRALAELRAAMRDAAHLAAVVSSASTPIISATLDGTIRTWNEAAERFFGRTSADMIGRALRETIPAGEWPREERLIERAVQGTVAEVETTRLRTDGSPAPVLLTVSPVFDAARRVIGLSSMFTDLSSIRLLEAELRQANKMEAMGRLAGGVAHDFNNLLTAIRAGAELLGHTVTDEAAREDLDEILHTVDRAATLTRQLLAFSRKQVVQPRRLKLNAVVAGTAAMLRRLLGEDVHLVLEEARSDPTVFADASQLERVLMNLAVNARDAMPEGGELRITTADGVVGHPPPGAPSSVLFDAAHVLLSVSDTGVGMDERTRQHAFEPFFTTKEEGRGTGLGLATVYGIAAQAKGMTWLTSERNRGTTVWLALPRATAPRGDGRTRPGGVVQRGRGRVLFVEDDAGVLGTVSRLLERHGYEVLAAASSDEALRAWEHAEAAGATPDVVVTDLVLPDGGAAQLIRWLRAQYPALPVVVVTGHAGEVCTLDDFGPSVALLEKPYGGRALFAALQRLLA